MTPKVKPTVEKWEERCKCQCHKGGVTVGEPVHIICERDCPKPDWKKQARAVLKHKMLYFPAKPILDDLIDGLRPIVKSLLAHSVQEAKAEMSLGRNWYFEGDELVITRGKWVIDRYKKHASLKQAEDRGEGDIEQLWYEQGVFDEEV